MPRLTFRGIDPHLVKDVTAELIPQLASLLETTEDNFTVDVLAATSFADGREIETFPFIEFGWFDRGQAVQDQAAHLMDAAFKAEGLEALEIVFIAYDRRAYYADGAHFG